MSRRPLEPAVLQKMPHLLGCLAPPQQRRMQSRQNDVIAFAAEALQYLGKRLAVQLDPRKQAWIAPVHDAGKDFLQRLREQMHHEAVSRQAVNENDEIIAMRRGITVDHLPASRPRKINPL